MGGGGLEGRDSAWGLSGQGGWGSTGPIFLSRLKRGTIFRGGLRDGRGGLLGDGPCGALAARAGSPEVASGASFEGLLARGALQRQGGRIPSALRGPGGPRAGGSSPGGWPRGPVGR